MSFAHAFTTPPVEPASLRPVLASLDCLGRLPIPLRRPVKAVVDRVAAAHGLSACLLMGDEWYAPFAELADIGARGPVSAAELPAMLVTSWSSDIVAPAVGTLLQTVYRGGVSSAPLHPLCTEAGLDDPRQVFRPFAVIPLVFLVDQRRLGKRPLPRSWQDVLSPLFRGEVVFGGWRPRVEAPYREINDYLLLAVQARFGDEGVRALAANVDGLVPNIRSSRIAGSNNPQAAAVAVMPWLQAAISPRRERVTVVWPRDGALAMPVWSLVQPAAAPRVRSLTDLLEGPELGRLLAANCYPPASSFAMPGAYPPGARLWWPGWEAACGPDALDRLTQARALFLASVDGGETCA